MNTILLNPTDVLFFRDGRPMGGSLSGHGAAWPLPNVISHAFHAALHRAAFKDEKIHSHRRGRSGNYQDIRDRKFGSLVTAGPFPVCTDGSAHTWFFPRPADADEESRIILKPAAGDPAHSSLPAPLKYAAASTIPPSKDQPKRWWSEGAWNAYLGTDHRDDLAKRPLHKNDAEFADAEHNYGIEISPDSGSVVEGQFYSASYLRLREGWRMGCLATAEDKDFRHPVYGNDLVSTLLNGQGGQIIVGGQQRVCTAVRDEQISDRLPLPLGKIAGFKEKNGKYLVKWVLLTPAIWPGIEANREKQINAHPGGWLPSWIANNDQTFEGELVEEGSVLLLDGPGKEKARRKKLTSGKRIHAHLVAAIVPKPLAVTGWALANGTDRAAGGAKSTHLAVPAGAVYYFEARSPEDAQALAAALNWHSDTAGTVIKNRRSTLMGEKGFGLGVCGAWEFHATSNSP